MLMEKAGTGGALFRNLYRDFLRESADLLHSSALSEAGDQYAQIARLWESVSGLFYLAGETEDIKYINEASVILTELSELESLAMEKLKTATT